MRKKRVVAHVFLCMLTYYVEYHMCRKLAPMLFAYDDPEEKQAQQNDAVEPAKLKAKKKAHTKKNEEGKTVMSFASLMTELAGLCRLVLLPKTGTDAGQKVTMLKTVVSVQESISLRIRKPCTHNICNESLSKKTGLSYRYKQSVRPRSGPSNFWASNPWIPSTQKTDQNFLKGIRWGFRLR